MPEKKFRLLTARAKRKAKPFELITESLRDAEFKLRAARVLGHHIVIIAHVQVRAYVFLHRNGDADRRIQWQVNMRPSSPEPMWANRSLAATAGHIMLNYKPAS